jgi:UPF0716 protein FxsA
MSLVKWTFLGLLVLPVAELGTLMLVAWAIGWFWALALFTGTSLLGLLLLHRYGRGHLDRFRQAVSLHGLRAIHLETPGAAPIVGGILLVCPGFVTDLVGLAVLLPPVRHAAAARLREARLKRNGASDREVIELPPTEWRTISSRTIECGRDP